MIEVFILSIIQGITEFLPVSSSSHLIIASKYLSFDNQNLSIDVSLHIGSFIAVIIYFRKDIFNFIKNKDLFFKIVISSIPVMLIGFLLIKFNMIDQLRNTKIIGWTTIIFGIFLYVSDKCNLNKKIEKDLKNEESDLLKKKNILSKEDYAKKSNELRKKVMGYQTERRAALDKITSLRAKSRQTLVKRIEPIVDNYIKENNISIVMDKKNMIGGLTEYDITKTIVEKLNQELPSLKLE